MPHPVIRRVLLVSSSDGTEPPWPLHPLRAHLQHEGHDVTLARDVDAVGSDWTGVDVIHTFGWSAARAVADRDGHVPWALTATWNGSGSAADTATGAARGADLVLCASSDDERAANRLGVSHQRCVVMPIAVDVEAFDRHGPQANRTSRQRIMVRAVGPGDGVLQVIAALAAIPGAELVILVGVSAPEAVGRHQQSLLDAAQRVGVRARVALVPARDPRERAWLLRSADVVVSVSGETGDHALVAEAMACGKATVVTATGPQRDLVVNDVTGLQVPAGRVRTLALSLRDLLRDPFTVEAMGLAGAERALSRCAWPRVAHEFASVYVRLPDRTTLPDEVGPRTTELVAPTALPGHRGSSGTAWAPDRDESPLASGIVVAPLM